MKVVDTGDKCNMKTTRRLFDNDLPFKHCSCLFSLFSAVGSRCTVLIPVEDRRRNKSLDKQKDMLPPSLHGKDEDGEENDEKVDGRERRQVGRRIQFPLQYRLYR